MDVAFIKVVGSSGVTRTFYGVKSVVRASVEGEGLTSVVEEHIPFEKDEQEKYAKYLGLDDVDIQHMGVATVINPNLEKVEGAGFFAFEEVDGMWTLVFYRGKAYICNEDGTTIDSFRSN